VHKAWLKLVNEHRGKPWSGNKSFDYYFNGAANRMKMNPEQFSNLVREYKQTATVEEFIDLLQKNNQHFEDYRSNKVAIIKGMQEHVVGFNNNLLHIILCIHNKSKQTG